MKFKILSIIILICFVNKITQANQIDEKKESLIIINENIKLPKDSLESRILINSINEFILSAQENSQKKLTLPTEAVEAQILIDELIDIQKSEEFKDEYFFKPYLTNIEPLEENKYLIKISYIGINEGVPLLRASFELIALKLGDTYSFTSTLKRNTKHWKTKKNKNQYFYYPYDIDVDKLEEYVDLVLFYDNKLKIDSSITYNYICKDESDPFKLSGLNYKLDYNGYDINYLYSTINTKTVIILTESDLYNIDKHDLWHNRISKVISRKKIHKRVDCHIATLHGGLWGFSWDELFPQFYQNFMVDDNVDWLKHKKDKSHFKTNGIRGKRNNYTDDFIGALLVQKIEAEKGFDSVWKLLNTKRDKDETEYFEMLEKLTGISKEDYNKEVNILIKEEMNKFN